MTTVYSTLNKRLTWERKVSQQPLKGNTNFTIKKYYIPFSKASSFQSLRSVLCPSVPESLCQVSHYVPLPSAALPYLPKIYFLQATIFVKRIKDIRTFKQFLPHCFNCSTSCFSHATSSPVVCRSGPNMNTLHHFCFYKSPTLINCMN